MADTKGYQLIYRDKLGQAYYVTDEGNDEATKASLIGWLLQFKPTKKPKPEDFTLDQSWVKPSWLN